MAGAVIAFILGRRLVRTREDRSFFFTALILGGIAYCLISLIIFSQGHSLGGRLDANMGSANSAASSFYLLLIISIARLHTNDLGSKTSYIQISKFQSINKYITLVNNNIAGVSLFFISLTCLLITSSRMGILSGLLGSILTYILIKLFHHKYNFNLMKYSYIIVFLIIILGIDTTLSRFETIDQDFETRSIMQKVHWDNFLDRPWIGHGMNSFHEMNMISITPENWNVLSTIGSVHSIYIQILLELGLVGSVLVLTLSILYFVVFMKILVKSESKSQKIWIFALCGILFSFLLHGFVDFGLQTPAIAALLSAVAGALITTKPAQSDRPMEMGTKIPAFNAKTKKPPTKNDDIHLAPVYLFLKVSFTALLCIVLFCVMEGASTASQLKNKIESIQKSELTPETKLKLFGELEETTIRKWSKPSNWHAGVEAHLSQAFASMAELTDDRELKNTYFEKSVHHSAASLELSPVNGFAWLHLADYAAIGFENHLCRGPQCLRLSQQTAPAVKNREFLCNRIVISNRLGVDFEYRKSDLTAYSFMSGKGHAKRCLGSYPSDLFYVLNMIDQRLNE